MRTPHSAIIENSGLRQRFREATYGASLAYTPGDIVHFIAYAALYSSMARIGVDTKLFEVLAASASPMSSEDVAEKMGVELVLASK